MEFTIATDAPIAVVLPPEGGQPVAAVIKTPDGKAETILFPVWELDELAALGQKLKAEKVAAIRAECIAAAVPVDHRVYMIANASAETINPFAIHTYFQTVDGVRECLTASLAKTGKTPEQIKAILKRFAFSELKEIAVDVAHMLEKGAPIPPAGMNIAPAGNRPPPGTGLGEDTKAPAEPPGLGEGSNPLAVGPKASPANV